MISLVTFLLSFGLAYLGTLGLLKIKLGRRFMDVPNRRSSHEIPKPRFGGIALVGAFLVGYAVLLAAVPGSRVFLPLVGGTVLLFAVGVVDDWRGLPVLVRFGAQIGSALILVGFGGVVKTIQLPMAGSFQLGPLAVPFTVVFVLCCVNFYNFIDGIDGLAAGSAFICAGFLSFIAFILGHTPLALLVSCSSTFRHPVCSWATAEARFWDFSSPTWP
jgi:UDP-GlcNAc:undecaprenyl-phosphate GlcNAc-1-phosphate transferase